MKSKVLIVDDTEQIVKEMQLALERDYRVLTACSEQDALAIFREEKPPVVISDLSLDPQSPTDLGGLRLLGQMLAEDPLTRVIIISGNNNDSHALQVVRLGAFDYYRKPIILDEMKVMIRRAIHMHQLQTRLHSAYSASGSALYGLVGVSKSIQQIYDFIERVAPSDISALICGDPGTGKEFVAHAIHQRSLRKGNPFIIANCGAIPEALLESDLFGHEKGAFAGAYTQKKGKIELAHRGTLFLDEIGELAPPLQVKLLGFLQNRTIERIGGEQHIELDVRVLAATNRDLKKDVENRSFREDLYYRLKVVPLTIPPLRDRKEDIVPLARYFLQKHCREQHKPLISLSADAERKLIAYSWPGNVRELENLINRAVVLSLHSVLSPNDLEFNLEQPDDVNLKYARKAMEADYVRRALLKHQGIISRAARDLGISRVNLYELIAKYEIDIGEFKRSGPGRQGAKGQQTWQAEQDR